MSENTELIRKRARTLNSISLLYLVYYFAGGQLEDTLSFLGSGIVFNRPELLKLFAVCYFLLVAYRYFLILPNPIWMEQMLLLQKAFNHYKINDEIKLLVTSSVKSNFDNYSEVKGFIPEIVDIEIQSDSIVPLQGGKGFIKIKISTNPLIGITKSDYTFTKSELRKVQWKLTRKYLFGMDESSLYFYPTLLFLLSFSILISNSVFKLIEKLCAAGIL